MKINKLSRGSRARRPGSEDPHWRQRKFKSISHSCICNKDYFVLILKSKKVTYYNVKHRSSMAKKWLYKQSWMWVIIKAYSILRCKSWGQALVFTSNQLFYLKGNARQEDTLFYFFWKSTPLHLLYLHSWSRSLDKITRTFKEINWTQYIKGKEYSMIMFKNESYYLSLPYFLIKCFRLLFWHMLGNCTLQSLIPYICKKQRN
jgi:hypothetical protein